MKQIIYRCEAPFCNYETEDKHQIHFHHIVSKSQGGKNGKYNLVTLCPNCHNRIYIPEAKRGIHSIKAKNYIILKRILLSTDGLCLEYETEDGLGYTPCDGWRKHFSDLIKNVY